MASIVPGAQPDVIGASLGQGMSQGLMADMLRQQFGHFLTGFGGFGLGGSGVKPMNIDALRKITDPRIMQIAAEALLKNQMAGEYTKQPWQNQFLTPQQQQQAAEVAAGLKPPAKEASPTEEISKKKLTAINALEKKLADGTATPADKDKFERAIGITTKTPEDRLARWASILDASTRPSVDPETGDIISHPMPNLEAEARRQMQKAIQELEESRSPAKRKKAEELKAAAPDVFSEPNAPPTKIVPRKPGETLSEYKARVGAL